MLTFITFNYLGLNDHFGVMGFTNMKIESIIDQTEKKAFKSGKVAAKQKEFNNSKDISLENYQNKRSIPDLSTYENLPYVKVNGLNKNRLSDFKNTNNDDNQMYSIFHSKNIEPSDSRAMLVPQVHYKYFNVTEYTQEERDAMNMPNPSKIESELNIEGKSNLLTPLETNIRQYPLKPRPKGSKLRKKSKVRDQKSFKEKEGVSVTFPTKSKSFKISNGSSSSTPINNLDKAQNVAEQTCAASIGYQKNSAHSFVFMKNSIESAKKVNNSAAVEIEEADDSKQSEIVKVQGKISYSILDRAY